MKMRHLSAFILLTLAVLTTARPKTEPEPKCKSGPVDLVFLIDSSRSVRPHEFETMRKFMIDILNTLDIGLNTTRVGVVQYSSQVRTEFTLKTHGKLDSMVKAINQIIPLAQGTMTGLAIRYMMNEAFTAEAGDRPKVPNVAVIVTDGRPQDRVAEVAANAREKGVEIYAVGVARADMTSLRAMASPPFEDHVFLVESFDLIHQFGLQFQDKLCGVDLCLESDHGCEHICESSPGSYHCLCLPGYTLNDDGKTCAEWLFECTVQKLVLVITCLETNEVLERWQFDIECDKSAKESSVPREKSIKTIQDEIRSVIRQITATVTFLPLLETPCAFDLLVYTDKDLVVPDKWEESGPQTIDQSEEVRLRSFTTSIHKVNSMVAYKKTDLV